MIVGDSQLNFEISDASDSLRLFGRGGFGGNGQRGDRAIAEVPSELQASIEALHESEEFLSVRTNVEELHDGLKELRDTVELSADFPNPRGLRVNISELLDDEDSLVLDELRVSVEELIASGELTDGSTLLASISELDASISALRASDEFAEVQATIAELIASGDLPEDFLDGGFPGGIIHIGGDRAIAEVPSELQASIEALRESEEFSEVSANIEELHDGLKELLDTVDWPADFPNIRGLHVNISELLDGEDSLVLDELRVSVEELIASGDLTDGTELLASIGEVEASIEALRASDEFAEVQATIAELIASGDLPEDFPDGDFLGGRFGGGDRDREGFPDEITGERLGGRLEGRLGGRLGGGDRFDGGIIGELAGDGESFADSEQLRDRIQELIASGDFDGLREGIGRLGGRDRFFGDDLGVDTGAILLDPVVVDEGSIVIV